MKFSAILLLAATQVFAQPRTRRSQDVNRLQWRTIVLTRTEVVLKVAALAAENPNNWNSTRAIARSVRLPERKVRAWRSHSVISVRDGLKIADHLNVAPWFLMGWDVLAKMYGDVVDRKTWEIDPAVLREIEPLEFREMARIAVIEWGEGLVKPERHVYERAFCATILKD